MDPKMGGVCSAVQMIIGGLNEFEIYSEVLCLDPPDSSYLRKDLYPIHAVGVGKTQWRYNPNLFKWLQENADVFDIFIVHGLWLYTSYAVRKVIAGMRKNNKKKPKVFIMPHGMLDPYFQRAPGRRIKAIRNWIFWKLIEQKVIHDADGLLFTCEMEKVLARTSFRPYRPNKELVVGLGVEAPPHFCTNMEEVFFSQSAFQNNQPYLLFIGRIHEKKGVDILINAYLNIKKKYSNLPCLVIAGPGKETEYGRSIQKIASKSSDIYFVGMLTGAAKWGAFYGCEAFILPSHQENFGIAVVEAMACGKPVLITKQINIWKEIADSAAGIVTEDTLSKIEQMLQDWLNLPLDEKLAMSRNSTRCFQKYFSMRAASECLKNVIVQ